MQRHGFTRFHLFPGPACAALAAALLGAAAACTGTIGAEPRGSAAGGPGGGAGTTGVGSVSGSAGASGTTGAGGATPTGTGAGSGGGAGTGAGTAGTSGTGGAPVVFAPSPGAYRRLTASAFRNSLRDLLQGPVTIGNIEPDSWSVAGLASVSAATVSVSAAGVEQYQTAIDAATSQAFADATRRSKLLGCTAKSNAALSSTVQA